MKHECCICNCFDGYYVKSCCCYLRTDRGYCSKKRQIVKKHETCENWRSKTINRKAKKSIVMQNLKDALTKLSVIEDYIKDDEQ